MKTNSIKSSFFRKAIKILAFYLLAGYILPANAQMILTGKVTDKTSGQPLPFAGIGIKNTYYTAVSNEQGAFIIDLKKKGNYSLMVSYLGYKTHEQSLNIVADTAIDIKLEPEALMAEEVVISGVRIDEKTPMTYSNVTKEQLESRNLGQDMPFLLQLTPSMVVTSDAGNGIGYSAMRIRGTDISRINVTINGIPYNDPESQSVYWVDVPDLASSVESLQVQRGVGTSTNGAGAFGASINISTHNVADKPYSEIQSGAGSFNTFRNSVKFGTGLIGKQWIIDGRLSKTSTNGYIDRARSGLGSWFTSLTMIDEKNLLKFNLFSGIEETYQAWNGVPSGLLQSKRTFNPSGLYYDLNGDTVFYDNETDHYQQDHYQLLYARTINRSTTVNLALHYTRGKGYYENYKMYQKFSSYGLDNLVIGQDTITRTDLIRQKWLDNHFYGATFNLQTQFGKNLELKTGGALNRYQGSHYGEIPRADFAAAIPEGHRWYENEGLKSDFNIYGKLNILLKEKLMAYLDLQYRHVDYQISGTHDNLLDISQKHLFNFFNPKAGLIFSPNDHLKYYFSAGVANREPTRNDFRDADPGNLPGSEKLTNAELGGNYQYGKIAIHANLYWMKYRDQLILTGKINNVGDPIMINVPESYRAGIEFSGEYTPVSWLNILLSTTLSRNKAVDFTEFVDNWSPPYEQIENRLGETDLAFSPGITGYGAVNLKILKSLTAAWMARYVGDQYIDNTSSHDRMLGAYLVNDLSFTYRVETEFIPVIEFNLLINNVFSEKYESNAWIYRYFEEGKEYYIDGYFPQAPMNLLAGIKLKF